MRTSKAVPKSGFFQIENSILDVYGAALGPYGIAVLNVLCRHRNHLTGQCFPSIKKIAGLAGITEPPVRKALKKLVAYELIRIIPRSTKDGDRTSNQYDIREPQVPVPERIVARFSTAAQQAHRKNTISQPSVDDLGNIEDHPSQSEDTARSTSLTEVVNDLDPNKTFKQNELKIQNNNSPEVVVPPLKGGCSQALPGKDFEAKKNPDSAAAGAALDGGAEGLAACLDKLGDVLPGLSTADVYRLRCAALKQKDDNPREALKVVEGVLASATEQKKSIQKPFAWALQAIRGEYKPRLKRSAVPSAPCAGSQGAHATKDGSATKAEKPGKTPASNDDLVFGVGKTADWATKAEKPEKTPASDDDLIFGVGKTSPYA